MKKGKGLLFLALLVLFLTAGVMRGGEAKAVATYKIKINKQCCVVNIYKYNSSTGKYKACKAFVCSPGYATPTGTFSLGDKMRWHVLDGPTYGQYCCRITGSILFHSVWYYQPEKNTQSYVQYNRLGTLASHGCVRLTVADAKWIYDNVPSGTSIKIYNSANPGPLGKPSAIKVNESQYQGWDPTDPDPANPYLKKNPKISGVVKRREIEYGQSVPDLKSGVTAKNSTGYNATSRIKIKLYFRANKTEPFVKVKSIDNTQVGTYKVLYTVTDEIGHKAQKKAFVKVKAAKLVKKIKLNTTDKTLYVGGKDSLSTFVLKAKAVKPDTANVKDVEFMSEGTKIAIVDEDGTVHALQKGEVYIRVKAVDGSGVYERCHIRVEQLVTSLTVTAKTNKLNIGKKLTLKVSVTPETADNQAVTFTSSKPEVATVSETGIVKAIAPGKTVIKVKAADKGGKSAKLTIKVKEPKPVEPVSEGAVSVEGLPLVTTGDEAPAEKDVPEKETVIAVDADSRVYGL